MKIAHYFFLLTVILLWGCSSDNNSEDDSEDLTAEFEYSINGTPMGVTVESAFKNSPTIHIGNGNINTSFLIDFDESGHFGKITCTYTDFSGTKRFTSYRNFSSNYFNFQLISYDAVNKRVKGTFQGNVYYDPADLNSEAKFINGSFDLPYVEYVPAVTNIINKATINGVNWRSTNMYQVRQGDYHTITLHSLSDDVYKVMFTFNDQNMPPGVYNFTSSSTLNNVQIAKFNVTTASYTLYNCTGTLTITNKWANCLKGTYSFTGVNPSDPNDIITVENGDFKLDYDLYN